MKFFLRAIAVVTAGSIITACSPAANGMLPATHSIAAAAPSGLMTPQTCAAPQLQGGSHVAACSTPDPCFDCWTAAPPPSSSAPGGTESGPYGPGFSGCLGNCGGLPVGSPGSGTPPGTGGPVGHPTGGAVLIPFVASIQNLLQNHGVTTHDITQVAADDFVQSVKHYPNFEPAFRGESIEGVWNQEASNAFDGGSLPDLGTPSTLTSDTLVQFGGGGEAGNWTTTLGTLTENNVTTAEGIQNLFAMPSVPTQVTAVEGYADGTEFVAGTAAENAFGAGGGLQIFGASEAIEAGSTLTIPEFLELLGGLLLLDRHHPVAAHR